MSTEVNRRRFLTRTVVGGLAALRATQLAARDESPPLEKTPRNGHAPRIRKALKYHMIRENLPLADKFKLIRDLGFEGLEIHRREKLEPGDVRQAAAAAGVEVHGVLNSADPDLTAAIDLAKGYGATSVLVVAGRVTAETPYDRNYVETQKRLRGAIPHAERSGIRLLVENVWNDFLLSPLEMARYLDELDSDAVGAYFDVGNVVRFGWPEQWIRILGRRIGKLDIKEYSRDKQLNEGLRRGFDVELGEGSIDWPEVRGALADVGYAGWATAEVPGGDRQRLADISRRMDRVLGLAE
ncbi:MAG TPA: sugar phosphate isomerase/epimerase family protein [Planctomycetaceae bacterium]|nr:sugar phosphate isomerase/epimerase family protein [Planctomycetaceae bacterium]